MPPRAPAVVHPPKNVHFINSFSPALIRNINQGAMVAERAKRGGAKWGKAGRSGAKRGEAASMMYRALITLTRLVEVIKSSPGSLRAAP